MDKRISTNQVVLFQSSNSKESYGEVIELKLPLIKIRELVKPDDIQGNSQKGGPNLFTGKRELFKTCKFFEIPFKSVQSSFPICTLSDYPSSKGFLLRQTYDVSTNFLHPDLPKICLCKNNLNPDLEYFICKTCSSTFHVSCVESLSCPDCELPKKRQTSENFSDPKPTKSLPPAKELPLDLTRYKSIPEPLKISLSEHIEHLHSEYLSIQTSLSPDERTRQQIICKIRCALSLAHEELKLLENSESLNVPSLSEVSGQIKKLSISLESAIFTNTGENVRSSEYSKKIRAVLFNLTQEKNHDFRRSIIKSELEPKDICNMQSRDMASSEIKNFRKERQKMYSKEQLILPQTAKKLVVKSRKGETIINVNDQLSSDDISASLLERYSKSTEKDLLGGSYSNDGPFSDLNFEETIKEWAGDAVLAKIEEKLSQSLPPDQSARVLSRIFSLRSKRSSS